MNKDSPRIIKEALTSIETFDSIVAKITTCSFVLFIQSLLRLRFRINPKFARTRRVHGCFCNPTKHKETKKKYGSLRHIFPKKEFFKLTWS